MSKSFDETDTRVLAFGERLRRERELRGISLDEIAAVTKIGTRLLRALEDEHFDLLPGGIFNKSYVRAYARHLGINEEQAVADYLKAAHETPPDVRLIAHQNSSMHSDPGRYSTGSSMSQRGFPLVPALILLVVIGGAIGAWRLDLQRQRERQQSNGIHTSAELPSAAGQTANSNSGGGAAPRQIGSAAAASPPGDARVTQVPANSPDATSAAVRTVEAAESSPHRSGYDAVPGTSASTAAAGSESDAPFEVTVRAKDHARVEIKSDGKVLLRGVMNPADVKTIHATNKVVFWTANAGEVELSLNGKNVPLNSGENDEQLLVFNSQGLLSRPAAR